MGVFVLVKKSNDWILKEFFLGMTLRRIFFKKVNYQLFVFFKKEQWLCDGFFLNCILGKRGALA